jgi:hypothetical protein
MPMAMAVVWSMFRGSKGSYARRSGLLRPAVESS